MPAPLGVENVNKGDALVLAGFGRTGFFESSRKIQLRAVETVFQQVFPASLEFTFGPTPGKSACRGDSGGPAYVFDELSQNLLLLGVTSRGKSGRVDSMDRPVGCVGEGFYTDVRQYHDWLRENL